VAGRFYWGFWTPSRPVLNDRINLDRILLPFNKYLIISYYSFCFQYNTFTFFKTVFLGVQIINRPELFVEWTLRKGLLLKNIFLSRFIERYGNKIYLVPSDVVSVLQFCSSSNLIMAV
jgi:hypothetical protein